MNYRNRLSKEQKEFIINNIKRNTCKEMNELFYKNYGIKLPPNFVRNFIKYHKISSGVNTRFKKGQLAHNHKPIGSEFISTDGYTFIKVEEPNKWELKQCYLYKKYKGEIPKKHTVLFLDQNKTNFDLDNLCLVEIRDKLVAKNLNLLSEDKELTKVGLLISKLINKTYDEKIYGGQK